MELKLEFALEDTWKDIVRIKMNGGKTASTRIYHEERSVESPRERDRGVIVHGAEPADNVFRWICLAVGALK